MTNIELAMEIAKRLHSGQSYGHLSMFDHVYAVANASRKIASNLDVGFSEQDLQEIVVVALLHDTVEDVLKNSASSQVFYYNLFGDKVSNAIITLTNRGNYEQYIERLCKIKLRHYSEYAAIVKFADSIVNHEMSKITGNQKRIEKYGANINIIHEALERGFNKPSSAVSKAVNDVIANVCWVFTPCEEV